MYSRKNIVLTPCNESLLLFINLTLTDSGPSWGTEDTGDGHGSRDFVGREAVGCCQPIREELTLPPL